MARSRRQKALSDILFRAMQLHIAEWNTTFDEMLEVLDDMRHAINVQKRTSDRPEPPKPKE